MKVTYKAHFWSLVGKADIVNENDEKLFTVKGKLFTFTDKKRIYDKDGNLIYTVRNKFFHIFYHRAFIFDANKNKVACVTRKLWTFNENFVVDGFQQDVRIDGDLIGLKFNVFVNNEEIAKITFEKLTTRAIEVKDPEDLPFVVALLTSCYNVIRNKAKN